MGFVFRLKMSIYLRLWGENMNIIVEKNAEILGKKASDIISGAIREAIKENGSARILLATGAS